MFYLIAQATTTPITTNDVSIWTELMEGAAKWGLGIALSILMFGVFFFLIKKVMANFETATLAAATQADKERVAHAENTKAERELFMQLLMQKDTTINNHLAHVQGALEGVEKSQIQITQTFERCSDKIVGAIDHQTDIMAKTMPCVKKTIEQENKS